MPTTSYIQIRFSDTFGRELLQAELTGYEPLGLLDEDASWCCFFTIEDWTRYAAEIESMVARSFPGTTMEVERIEPQNWNAEWEASIQPIRVSERFIIAPSWHPVDQAGDALVLTIDPKMSFGTGYHETTRLMLRAMEDIPLAGRRVLDVGTGTGVLAIAARLLGAAPVLGVDIDAWSFDNAEENRVRNGITDGLTFREGTADVSDGIFDVILSNITRNDNISLLPLFHEMSRGGSHLVLSGFHIPDQNDLLRAAADAGFTFVRFSSEGEWAVMELVRKG